MDLLPTTICRAGNNYLHRWSDRTLKRLARALDHSQGRIVRPIGHENDFKARIVLAKDRRNVLMQAIIDAAQRQEYGDIGGEVRVVVRQFGLQIPDEANPSAQGQQSQPNGNRSKEVKEKQQQ